MRNGVINEIHDYMKKNKQSYFLTGDLGYNLLEGIEKDFPDRFINVGVAEQNMIGIASGLALSGKKVFVYSIIPFLIMRDYEQIRNDICYHKLDITLLGIGSGISYGILSNTHFALEDVAILRPLPNMVIFSPSDEIEAVHGIRYFNNHRQPLYIRIGLRSEPIINKEPYDFLFSRGNILQKGEDIVIFVTGTLMEETINAAVLLKKEIGTESTIVNIHVLKPIDKDIIIKTSINKKLVVTVEEHGLIGGLGAIVSETLAQCGIRVKVLSIGIKDKLIKQTGTRVYLRKLLKLDYLGIYSQIWQALRK